MKRYLAALFIVTFAVSPLSAATWLTDHQAAFKAAAEKNRPILVNFTGSDWCGWCIKLRKEVFDTPEFAQYADEKLILLEVDFPERKPQSAAQQRANQALQQKYGVRGYPTLFLLDAKGAVKQQLGYMPGGPKAFLPELDQGVSGKSGRTVAPPTAPTPEPPAPEPAQPIMSTTPVKVTYDRLLLKGITGSANKPLALINNKTFSPGDVMKVQVGEQSLKVRCDSIGKDSVTVYVDEEKEPRKLILGSK